MNFSIVPFLPLLSLFPLLLNKLLYSQFDKGSNSLRFFEALVVHFIWISLGVSLYNISLTVFDFCFSIRIFVVIFFLYSTRSLGIILIVTYSVVFETSCLPSTYYINFMTFFFLDS